MRAESWNRRRRKRCESRGAAKGVDTKGEDRERRGKKIRAEEDAVRSQGQPQGQLSE